MKKPAIWYLVASPAGDMPVDSRKLDLPLEADPLRTPYRNYFRAISDFILKENCMPLVVAIRKSLGLDRQINDNDIVEIVIRAEKHGTLYHPASIEVAMINNRMKFGLNVAVTPTGKDSLKREFVVLDRLHKKFGLPYVPKPYYLEELDSIVFLIEEWFEGYHEFHVSNSGDGRGEMKLWEYGKGDRILLPEQSFEIYRQASQILTLYYAMDDFCQICPWHHAAGDFIARVGDDKIDVRLTTARRYEPYMVFQEQGNMNPVIALLYFLLNLALRMRLDRLDGVGDIIWAADFCLEAAVKGFFDGLSLKDESRIYFGSADEFITVLKSFSLEDLKTAYNPLIDMYRETGDYQAINANIDRHLEAFYTILQNFPS